jgi:hypothetical protein
MSASLHRRRVLQLSGSAVASLAASVSTLSAQPRPAPRGTRSAQPRISQTREISLTMADSPLKNGLDAWYSYLVELLKPGSKRKVALNDVITPADIYSNTNFYDQYIFRTFVDRLILTSPEDYLLGNANSTSAYSYYWQIMLERIIADIDVNLSSDDQNKIDEYDRQINDLRDKYGRVRTDLEDRWKKYAGDAGIDPKTDPYFIFKKKKFADDQGYATQLTGIHNDIKLRLTKQSQIRLKTANEQDRILISTYQYTVFDEYKLVLPKIPDFEQAGGLSPADLTNLAVTGAAGEFDSDVEIRPVGDLRNFFANEAGTNSVKIDKRDTWDHQHDAEWGASASGGWGFFRASVSATNQSHIRESLDQVRSITIGWKNMANYFVRRGRWFNVDILGYKRIQKILDDDKRLKEQLSRTVASLVLARGINITLEFSDAKYMERWEKSTFSGSAGVSIFGIDIGGGGSGYSYDWQMEKHTETKSVTLIDDPRYARVCAFMSEEVIPGVSEQDIRDDFLESRYYTPAMINRFK